MEDADDSHKTTPGKTAQTDFKHGTDVQMQVDPNVPQDCDAFECDHSYPHHEFDKEHQDRSGQSEDSATSTASHTQRTSMASDTSAQHVRCDFLSFWKTQGLDIHVLVNSDAGYIVYLDSALDVDWRTTSDFDATFKGTTEDLGKVLNRLAVLHSTPVEWLSGSKTLAFRRMLGEALVREFENHPLNAMEMLDSARDFVVARNHEHARIWYLTASGCLALIGIVFAIALWCARLAIMSSLGQTFLDLLLTACAGGLGAFFSILLRMDSTALDSAAGPKVHYIEASARYVAGCVGATIACLAMKLGLLLPAIGVPGTTSRTAGLVLIGLIAGASERLVPAFIQRVEVERNEPQSE